MTKFGRSRVMIESVSPTVDAGLYPAKRSIGESVKVGAHIFGDGHDYIRAFVKYKAPGKRRWEEKELVKIGNDEWEAEFVTDQKGLYEFRVDAWIDHLLNWYEGFKKKTAAGIRVNVELIEGADLLVKVQKNLGKKADARLKEYEGLFRSEGDYDIAVNRALSLDFADLVKQCPLPAFESSSEAYLINCEHAKANFSTWYEFFPRSVSPEIGKHGTFKDCLRLLPKIADMGFDVLYF
ncbi:MAG: maltotransferase domain-containing protein, partial [Bacteroidota bacterium]